MTGGELFVSFWHLSLDNLPEGAFVHRSVTPAEAKQLIESARQTGTLRCSSEDDLLAPYHEQEEKKYGELCRILAEHYGIELSLGDFVIGGETNDDDFYSIRPLVFAEVAGESRLLVVNCLYTLDDRREKNDLRFDVAPESVTFHLFEALDRVRS